MPSSSMSREAKWKSDFAVLHAVVALLRSVPTSFVGDVHAREHFLEDVGNGLLLEDAALRCRVSSQNCGTTSMRVAREGEGAFGLGRSG